jgi:hypothetical protein
VRGSYYTGAAYFFRVLIAPVLIVSLYLLTKLLIGENLLTILGLAMSFGFSAETYPSPDF